MWIKVEWEPTWKAIQISEVFKFLTGSDTSILGTGGGWGPTYRPLNLINRGRGQGGGCLESRSGRRIGLFEFQKCPRKNGENLDENKVKYFWTLIWESVPELLWNMTATMGEQKLDRSSRRGTYLQHTLHLSHLRTVRPVKKHFYLSPKFTHFYKFLLSYSWESTPYRKWYLSSLFWHTCKLPKVFEFFLILE